MEWFVLDEDFCQCCVWFVVDWMCDELNGVGSRQFCWWFVCELSDWDILDVFEDFGYV